MRGKKNLAGKIPNEVTFGMYKKLSRYSISDPHIHCEADIILTLCSSLMVSFSSATRFHKRQLPFSALLNFLD